MQQNVLKVYKVTVLIMQNGPHQYYILYWIIIVDALTCEQYFNVVGGQGGTILTALYPFW